MKITFTKENIIQRVYSRVSVLYAPFSSFSYNYLSFNCISNVANCN